LSFSLEDKSVLSIETWVDRATITVGDRTIYTMLIKAGPQLKVEPPSLGSYLGAFEIKDFNAFPPQKDKEGRSIYKYQYNLTIFDVGEYVIPPVEVTYTDSSGEKKILLSDRLFITVKSVSGEDVEMADIRGIKPPIGIKGGYGTYYVIFLILIAALAVLFFYLRARSRALKIPEIEMVRRPAGEVAYSELEGLKNSELLKEGRIKEYFIILSDIIKKYLQERFSFSALDKTTDEIQNKLKEMRIKTEQIDSIYSFFGFCDLVKFAKYIPPAHEIEKAFENAKLIVDQTLPEEELVLEEEEVVA